LDGLFFVLGKLPRASLVFHLLCMRTFGFPIMFPPKDAMKKAAAKETKAPAKKNKLGVKNSLVNNINARKKKGISRSKSAKTVDKESYDEMEDNWEKD